MTYRNVTNPKHFSIIIFNKMHPTLSKVYLYLYCLAEYQYSNTVMLRLPSSFFFCFVRKIVPTTRKMSQCSHSSSNQIKISTVSFDCCFFILFTLRFDCEVEFIHKNIIKIVCGVFMCASLVCMKHIQNNIHPFILLSPKIYY